MAEAKILTVHFLTTNLIQTTRKQVQSFPFHFRPAHERTCCHILLLIGKAAVFTSNGKKLVRVTPTPPPGTFVWRAVPFCIRGTRTAPSTMSAFDVQQIPPYNSTNNQIHIDFLTGRAQRIELQLQ